MNTLPFAKFAIAIAFVCTTFNVFAQDSNVIDAMAGSTLILSPAMEKTEATALRVSEYRLKLNLIKKFMGLVEWKDAAKRSRMPFVIAVLGENKFGNDIFAFQSIQYNGRSIEVQVLADVSEITRPDMLIICSKEESIRKEAIKAVANKPILTIFDIPNMDEGVINFFEKDNTIQFSINDSLSQQVGITINPSLLRYAAKR